LQLNFSIKDSVFSRLALFIFDVWHFHYFSDQHSMHIPFGKIHIYCNLCRSWGKINFKILPHPGRLKIKNENADEDDLSYHSLGISCSVASPIQVERRLRLSLSRMMRSASAPKARLPFLSSMPSAVAGWSEAASSASTRLQRALFKNLSTLLCIVATEPVSVSVPVECRVF